MRLTTPLRHCDFSCMLLVSTALMLEARPLVESLGLKALPNEPFPAFSGRDWLLVVTGTGSVKAAAATGWAMGRFPGIQAAVNIGFCGASPTVAHLHEWFYIHSVKDAATGRLLLPDILQAHPFAEKALLTVPEVLRADNGWTGLVDMEGSGFMEAARRFIAPDRIALLKWVSDPLSGEIDVCSTRSAYAQALPAVIAFLHQWPGNQAVSEGSSGEEPLLRECLQRLKLTRTQQAFLRKWLRGYLARGGDPTRVREALPVSIPCNKKANTECLDRMKNVLKN